MKRKAKEINLNINKKIKKNISDPKYYEPFKFPEWQREVVYRKPSNNIKAPKADVSYYLKIKLEDKVRKYKFRSSVDVYNKLPDFERYLRLQKEPPSGLTVDNFTFYRKPLGLNDRSKEIIRNAGIRSTEEKLIFMKKIKITKDSTKLAFINTKTTKNVLKITSAVSPLKTNEFNKEMQSKTISGLTLKNITFENHYLVIDDQTRDLIQKTVIINSKNKDTSSSFVDEDSENLENTPDIVESTKEFTIAMQKNYENISDTQDLSNLNKICKQNSESSSKNYEESLKTLVQEIVNSQSSQENSDESYSYFIDAHITEPSVEIRNENSNATILGNTEIINLVSPKELPIKKTEFDKDLQPGSQIVTQCSLMNFNYENIPVIESENAAKESIQKVLPRVLNSKPEISENENKSCTEIRDKARSSVLIQETSNFTDSTMLNNADKTLSASIIVNNSSRDNASECSELANKNDISELENESTMISDRKIIDNLFQGMESINKSVYLEIENKIKNTKTEFKKIEYKINEVRFKEKKTHNFLLDKIKKLELEFADKNKEAEELKKSHENEILKLQALYLLEVGRVQNEALADKHNYESKLKNEIQKSAHLETQLKEEKNIKHNILKKLGNITQKYN